MVSGTCPPCRSHCCSKGGPSNKWHSHAATPFFEDVRSETPDFISNAARGGVMGPQCLPVHWGCRPTLLSNIAPKTSPHRNRNATDVGATQKHKNASGKSMAPALKQPTKVSQKNWKPANSQCLEQRTQETQWRKRNVLRACIQNRWKKLWRKNAKQLKIYAPRVKATEMVEKQLGEQ